MKVPHRLESFLMVFHWGEGCVSCLCTFSCINSVLAALGDTGDILVKFPETWNKAHIYKILQILPTFPVTQFGLFLSSSISFHHHRQCHFLCLVIWTGYVRFTSISQLVRGTSPLSTNTRQLVWYVCSEECCQCQCICCKWEILDFCWRDKFDWGVSLCRKFSWSLPARNPNPNPQLPPKVDRILLSWLKTRPTIKLKF